MAESDDKDSKTEQATEKKIQDAVDKGNVPVSREAGTFASILGILTVFVFLVADSAQRIKLSLRQFIDTPEGWSLETGADVVNLFQVLGREIGGGLIPIVAILAVLGVSASLAQNPPSIVLHRIKPDASKLSLAKGWTRIFGAQGRVEFLKALFKFLSISLIAFILIRSSEGAIFNSMFMEPSAVPSFILSMTIQMLSAVAVATAVLAVADVAWSRFHWNQELMMSKQDVKDETKQSEGDPIVKGRLRSLARDRSRRRMLTDVTRATLVLANPTHFSVALRYVPEEGGAPLVVAKGQDLIALKIREVAGEHDIPVVEDKLLARSLYDSVEVDQMIPPEFYKAVAEIVFILMRDGAAPTSGDHRP